MGSLYVQAGTGWGPVITEDEFLLYRANIGGFDAAIVASVEFRSAPADVEIVLKYLADTVAAIVDGTIQTWSAGPPPSIRLTFDAVGAGRLFVSSASVGGRERSFAHRVMLVVDEPGELTRSQVAEMLAAVGRLPFSHLERCEMGEQMPLTACLPDHLPAGALKEVAPVLTVHHMTDFLVLVDAIARLGVPPAAMTVLDKGYRYTHRDRVDAHLRQLGIAVWPWTEAADGLADHVSRADRSGRSCILVDDGGYTLPVLMDARPDLVPSFSGLVEQTMSGIYKLERFGDGLPVPVFSVAESRLKGTIESYGIADAAVRNVLRLLPHEKFEGQPALVVGFGRIGEQVAELLRARRMRVAVFDRRLASLIAAHERGFLTARSLPRLLDYHRPMLVFGCTGRVSLHGEHALALRRDCFLVSTTSRDYEFALDEIAEESRRVTDAGMLGMRFELRHGVTATVVADGYPVNFHHAESLPNKYADLILASLVMGAVTLARPDHGFRPGHNVEATDRVLESCGLLERYYSRFGPEGLR
ncbi:MAG: NAD(P)-dependent oxidoreductase [Micromonosporaceae bacterium]